MKASVINGEVRGLMQDYLHDIELLELLRNQTLTREEIDISQIKAKVEEEDDNEFANKKLRVLNYLEEVYEGEISVEGEVDREKLKYDALLLTSSW